MSETLNGPNAGDGLAMLIDGEAPWRYRAVVDGEAGDWRDDPADAAAPHCGRWVQADWPARWRAFGPVPAADREAAPQLPGDRRVPDRLRIGEHDFEGRPVGRDAAGAIDLGAAFGGFEKQNAAWLLATIDVDAAQTIAVHAGADWWMRWLVDGEPAYETPPGGNRHGLTDRSHVFELTLAPGRHLLAVRVIAGTGGWGFATEAVRCAEPPADARAVTLEGRSVFKVDRPDAFASLTLVGDVETRINDRPIPLPLEGMRYRRVPGIPTDLLRPGENAISRRWTIEPGEAAARLAPLRVFRTAGDATRVTVTERLWAVPPGAARVASGPLLAPRPGGGTIITCRTNARCALEASVGGQALPPSQAGLVHRFEIDDDRAATPFTLKPVAAPRTATVAGRLPGRAGSERLRLAIASDGGPMPEMWARVAAAIGTHRPDLLVFVGDHVSRGREDHQWDEQYIGPAADLLAVTPMCPVPGNHDQDAPLMRRLWPVFNHGRHWSLRRGPSLLVGLDGADDWADDGGPARWLDALLGRSDAPFVFVFNHYPAYSSGVHTRCDAGGRPVEAEVRAARDVILPILARHGATAVFSGHDHGYERFEPGDGPTLIVAAGAGAYLYDDHAADRPDNPPRAARAEVHHYVLIDLTPTEAALRAADVSGRVLDERRWSARATTPVSARR